MFTFLFLYRLLKSHHFYFYENEFLSTYVHLDLDISSFLCVLGAVLVLSSIVCSLFLRIYTFSSSYNPSDLFTYFFCSALATVLFPVYFGFFYFLFAIPGDALAFLILFLSGLRFSPAPFELVSVIVCVYFVFRRFRNR